MEIISFVFSLSSSDKKQYRSICLEGPKNTRCHTTGNYTKLNLLRKSLLLDSGKRDEHTTKYESKHLHWSYGSNPALKGSLMNGPPVQHSCTRKRANPVSVTIATRLEF